ncbi:MAG: hypothetical protein K8W52_47150 [Deltaproteobacteria bacterium]|nr:hypothetical protein [Deltaproteobacteria bacterium]
MAADEGEPALSSSAEAALAALQRSVAAIEEFVERTSRQALVIASLESELGRAREQHRYLEQELARLRVELTNGDPMPAAERDALVEDQNIFAHMFVTSDRLAHASSASEALDIGVEVLHNLAGVHRYAVWLVPAPGAPLRMVAPSEARFRGAAADRAIVLRAIATGRPTSTGGEPGALPGAFPLLLDGIAVGAIELVELVPQVGARLGRLQDELLQFLSERLALSICQADARGRADDRGWIGAIAGFALIAEEQP